MIKFPSIEQYKNVIKTVRDYCNKHGTEVPTLKFIGTVKQHGSNGGIRRDPDGKITFQSRERDLTIDSDNAGFCMWGERNIDIIKQTFDNVEHSDTQTVVIFGEWAGGSIQKGVALNQLQKMFTVFNVHVYDQDGEKYYSLDPDEIHHAVVRQSDIFTVYDFPTYEIEVDFNAPQLVQNKIVELTLAVEAECPVGKHFGVSGVGEGIVFTNHELGLKFKSKGEKHSVSKVKTVKEIAACDIERMNSIDEFVETVITENRLNQGLDKLGEMGLTVDVKNTGAYLKWLVNNCLTEEKDSIIESGFEVKEITPKLSEKAKKFWFAMLEKV